MGWLFWRRQPNPLDTEALRAIEQVILDGDLRAAADQLKGVRSQNGDSPGVRYLEALVYHDGLAVGAQDLLDHLKPALATDQGFTFPEAQLLKGRLLSAIGDLDGALKALEEIAAKKLSLTLKERIATTASAIRALCGADGLRRIGEGASSLAKELGQNGVNITWSVTDLARLDSWIDEHPEKIRDDRGRWTSLLGEIAVRGRKGAWLLALRPEERAVRIGDATWPVGKALKNRLLTGDALYQSIHEALQTPRIDLSGIPGCAVVVEAGAHPAVVADHIARKLQTLGVDGLGVFRQRLSANGTITLPVSFVDKADVQRVIYIETHPWTSDRMAVLRRWTWRLRTSVARHAEVSIASSSRPPTEATRLVEGRAEAPAPTVGVLGQRMATPRSLDEPKLRWLDERAEVMERLMRASFDGDGVPDLEIVRKLQRTIINSFYERQGEFSPKQWHALYGYGALFGRILGRNFEGRWTGLADDTQPSRWEMRFANNRSSRPIGSVLKLAQLGPDEGDLVAEFTALRAASLSRDSG